MTDEYQPVFEDPPPDPRGGAKNARSQFDACLAAVVGRPREWALWPSDYSVNSGGPHVVKRVVKDRGYDLEQFDVVTRKVGDRRKVWLRYVGPAVHSVESA